MLSQEGQALLAVDLGLRTGFALYGEDGKLRWYRSQHFGNAARLKRAVYSMLHGAEALSWLYLEGGGDLAQIWKREAARRQLSIRMISAEEWRRNLLYDREQRSGVLAKRHAGQLARRIIQWSGLKRPTSLRHDAAEAILIGLWGVLEVRWLHKLPQALRDLKGGLA